MVKIKTKKEMTLSELVKYGFNNPKKIRGKIFKPQSFDSFWNPVDVRFSDDGCAVNVNGSVTDEDVYTVEVEEPITEDTEFETLIEVTEHQILNIRVNRSIKEIKDFNSLEFHALVNGRLTLIWTNEKGLIK